jgi:Tfp pilus assembly protein PilX
MRQGQAGNQRTSDQHGVALLIAVVLLLMISALGLTALQSAQDEATGSARGRRKTMTLYAADSGLKLVEDQLSDSTIQYPNRNPVTTSSVMEDQWGGTTAIRTGEASNPVAQPIDRVGKGNVEGFSLSMNSAGSFSYGIYRTGIVATDNTGGVVELQAQYSVNEGTDSYK